MLLQLSSCYYTFYLRGYLDSSCSRVDKLPDRRVCCSLTRKYTVSNLLSTYLALVVHHNEMSQTEGAEQCKYFSYRSMRRHCVGTGVHVLWTILKISCKMGPMMVLGKMANNEWCKLLIICISVDTKSRKAPFQSQTK